MKIISIRDEMRYGLRHMIVTADIGGQEYVVAVKCDVLSDLSNAAMAAQFSFERVTGVNL